MSLIKIEGVASTSAPTKAQKDAAVYLFGSKGHSIVAVLDKFSRAKELRTAHLDGLLKLMKEGDDDDIIKFGASALGKKTIQNAKAFAVAKTLTASIKALKLIRVPVKWVEGHSDAAAARAQETKEIRARKTAGNKVEKPIKLDNPGAPEAETATRKAVGKQVSKSVEFAYGPPARTIEQVYIGNLTITSLAQEAGLTVTLDKPKGPGKGVSVTVTGPNAKAVNAFIKQNITGRAKEKTAKQTAAVKNKSYLDILTFTPNANGKDVQVDGSDSALGSFETDFVSGAPASLGVKFVPQHGYGFVRAKDVVTLAKWVKWANKKAKRTIVAAPVAAASAKETYTPSGKSDVTLVDELAEVTARKIAAKPLQAREEYFNALRNTLHSNLRNSVVNTTSDGVTVALGSKLYTIRLADNVWTIQTGVTGKPKKVGATFDIVDLLGMMDKSILRPKPNAAKPASVAAPKAAEPVKSKTSVRKTDAQKWSERGLSPDIARLIPNQERRRDSFYLALANIATSHPDFDMSRVNIYEPGSLLSIATPIGDWRLIRGDKGWPELQLSERGRSPTVEVPTWDSAKTRYVNIFDSIEKGVYDTGAKLERVLDGMVTSKTMFSNERAPYRVNYDPADQNNYDLTLINMTPEDYRRSDSKTSRDFAYNYIQYTIQYKIGHENWVEFDDHDGKPKWNIEYGDKKFVLKAHGTKAWELVRTDKKASVPVDLGAFIDPNKVAKLVMQ